jgi:TPR repeat protein
VFTTSCDTIDSAGRLAEAVDDPAAYGKRVERECADGNAKSCTSHGTHHAYGTMGRTQDHAAALPILQKACDLGDPEGCKALGVMLEHGRGAPKDLVRALDLYIAACGDGVGLACQYAGDFHRHGRGVPVDTTAASEWYAKACAAGVTSSCDAPK